MLSKSILVEAKMDCVFFSRLSNFVKMHSLAHLIKLHVHCSCHTYFTNVFELGNMCIIFYIYIYIFIWCNKI